MYWILYSKTVYQVFLNLRTRFVTDILIYRNLCRAYFRFKSENCDLFVIFLMLYFFNLLRIVLQISLQYSKRIFVRVIRLILTNVGCVLSDFCQPEMLYLVFMCWYFEWEIEVVWLFVVKLENFEVVFVIFDFYFW